jgi:hypothetical protein
MSTYMWFNCVPEVLILWCLSMRAARKNYKDWLCLIPSHLGDLQKYKCGYKRGIWIKWKSQYSVTERILKQVLFLYSTWPWTPRCLFGPGFPLTQAHGMALCSRRQQVSLEHVFTLTFRKPGRTNAVIYSGKATMFDCPERKLKWDI